MSGDGDDYKKSMESISGIFTDIAGVAEAQSQQRCPYRNRHDHCTGLFICGHQAPVAGDDPAVLICTHAGGNDYAMLWTQDARDGTP
jgi:hypothetical protein